MAKELLLRGGSTSSHGAFIGKSKEVTVDTTKKTLVVHDNITPGGHPIAKEIDLNNHINDLLNPHGVTKVQVGLGNVDNTADINKNVLSATKWTTARTIALIGDVTGSVSIDGSANVSITTTVADDSHNHIISNVDGLQAALDSKANQATTYTKIEVDSALALKVDDTEIASVNLLRADKYLAAQNIANMLYTDGNLTKIQYNNATDVDYEVFWYVSGNLSTIQHYVGSVLKGTTTLSYTDGNLVSAIFVGV